MVIGGALKASAYQKWTICCRTRAQFAQSLINDDSVVGITHMSMSLKLYSPLIQQALASWGFRYYADRGHLVLWNEYCLIRLSVLQYRGRAVPWFGDNSTATVAFSLTFIRAVTNAAKRTGRCFGRYVFQTEASLMFNWCATYVTNCGQTSHPRPKVALGSSTG